MRSRASLLAVFEGCLMLVFIDTEFTGFEPDAQLISIGLVSERSETESLYLENKYFDRSICNDFVKSTVIPLLEGGERVCPLGVMGYKVWDWLEQLHVSSGEPIEIAVDYTGDWYWLMALLSEALYAGVPKLMPPGLSAQPVAIWDLISDKRVQEMERSWVLDRGLREHHALDDAIRNRYSTLVLAPVVRGCL